jgi:hypothetical protein
MRRKQSLLLAAQRDKHLYANATTKQEAQVCITLQMYLDDTYIVEFHPFTIYFNSTRN